MEFQLWNHGSSEKKKSLPSREREDRRRGGEEEWFEYIAVIGRKFSVMGMGSTEIQRQEIKDSKQAQKWRVEIMSFTGTWFQTSLIGCFLAFLHLIFAHPSLHSKDSRSPNIGTFTHLLNSMTPVATPMSLHKTNLLKRVQDLSAGFVPPGLRVHSHYVQNHPDLFSPLPRLFSMVVLFLFNTLGLICFYLHSVWVFFLLPFLIRLYFSNM